MTAVVFWFFEDKEMRMVMMIGLIVICVRYQSGNRSVVI